MMVEHDTVLPVVVNWRRDSEGVRSAILFSIGRKYAKLVVMDYPMRVTKAPLVELNYMQETGYGIARAGKLFRKAAKRWHGKVGDLPKSVKEVLRGL